MRQVPRRQLSVRHQAMTTLKTLRTWIPLSSFNMSVTINDNGQTSATRDVNEFNTFDNLLKTAVDTELNFSYNTDNEFNKKISALKGFVEISVFHTNIRSLNKNDNKLWNF